MQGLTAEAGEWFKEADTAAQLALTGSDDTGLQPLSATKELAADILLGQAQVASAQKAWEEAEQYLSKVWSISPLTNSSETGSHCTSVVLVCSNHIDGGGSKHEHV